MNDMTEVTTIQELEHLATDIVAGERDLSGGAEGAFSPFINQDPMIPMLADRERELTDAGQNPVIVIRGKKYDSDTIKIAIVIITIWVIIWYNTGLLEIIKADKIFLVIFAGFILWVIGNILTAGTTSGSVIFETNTLLTVEQMISILFGTMVIFALFHRKLKLESACKDFVGTIIAYIILLLGMASMWVNLINSGRIFKAIRRFKQSIYNIALSLFMTICLIAIRGGPCVIPKLPTPVLP